MNRGVFQHEGFMTAPAEAAAERLSDDEHLFYRSVYEFADREIRPRVREMDEQAHIPHDLIEQLFALGVMAIEIPERYDGAGASFFHAVLAVEALSRVDPSIGGRAFLSRDAHSGCPTASQGTCSSRSSATRADPMISRDRCIATGRIPPTSTS